MGTGTGRCKGYRRYLAFVKAMIYCCSRSRTSAAACVADYLGCPLGLGYHRIEYPAASPRFNYRALDACAV